MLKFYPFFIGLRYSGSQKRSQLVSFISLISMLGLVLGVALLVVVLSVMNGFDKEMRSRILGLVPHISISAYNNDVDFRSLDSVLNTHPDVLASAPFVEKNALLKNGADVEPMLLYGIDPKQEVNVSIIGEFISEQTLAQLDQVDDGIVVGAALAKTIELTVGQSIILMLPNDSAANNKRNSLRFKRMQVLGIFNTGTEIDQSVALVNLNTALSLLDSGMTGQGVRVRVNDIFAAPRIAFEIENNIPFGFSALDWTRTHGNLYESIQLSKQLVGLMLLTIIAVAAFNVVSALVMIVTDKRGDIAIMRTIGASRGEIMMIFIIQGTLIGLVGTLIGCLIGLGISLVISDAVMWFEQAFSIQFLNSDVYPISYLPSDIRFADVFRVALVAMLMSCLATIYPAWRAARVEPAKVLRYE